MRVFGSMDCHRRRILRKTPPANISRANDMTDELQIIDLQPGDGKAAVKGALITTQYTGWLEDGTEFDSSWSRGKPFQCVIGTGRVIKGWEQVFCK